MKCKTQLSKGIMDRVKEETRKEFIRCLSQYNREANIQVMYVLHFGYDFGQKRIEDFMRAFRKAQEENMNRYELEIEDTEWLYEKQLKDDGIDVEKALLAGGDGIG